MEMKKREKTIGGRNYRAGMVYCKAFLREGTDSEDLFQIGSIGLLKAIDKFDLNYDVKFSTYAVPMISGEDQTFFER